MASNRRDEQEQEIDCLKSMFPEELSVVETKPCFVFEISLRNVSEDEQDCEVAITLRFTLISNYPDEPPQIEVTDSWNLIDEELAGITEGAKTVCQESLGMPMIFSVVMQVQEALASAVQRVVRDCREASDRAKIERELAERKRFDGTPVTVDNFLAWKRRFDAEMTSIRAAKLKSGEISTPRKPTGKELFQRDEALVDSDLAIAGGVAGIADDDDVEDSSEEDDDDAGLVPDLEIDD